MDKDELDLQHEYVIKKIQKFLKDCHEENVRTDLVIFASLTVILDYALETTPDKETLFGLIATCMSAAYDAYTNQHNEDDEEDEEKIVH